ncbi:variable surface protein [Plasmodium gonderi]|uniref:Variable surface protein n=1 Tax=Plasmodium gonderi TaxID=77519 RepID=A0A1Y1JQ76_PLAGO|nr:variable surface protein [Plasmodium gonderi]GAW84641.1 variable surface protein [Plasmodium gonderi]
MDGSNGDTHNFNFKGVFPKSIQFYNEVEKEYERKYYNNSFYNLCIQISKLLGIWDGDAFINNCVYFSNYLQRIKDIAPDNIRSYCIYFNYVLKSELKNLKSSCKGEKACYKKMIDVYVKNGKNDRGKCESYVKDLNEDIYKILNNLNTLYNYLEPLKNSSKTCNSYTYCIKNYYDFLKNCEEMKNSSLNEVMEIVKEIYKPYIQTKKETINIPEHIHFSNRISSRKKLKETCNKKCKDEIQLVSSHQIKYGGFINNDLNYHITL